MAGARCAITSLKFSQLFSFSKLLVVVLGPVSVDELVSVEYTYILVKFGTSLSLKQTSLKKTQFLH